MKRICERLLIAEYDYPLADRLNSDLHQIILDLPDSQNKRTSVQAKMTSWNTNNEKFDVVKNFTHEFIKRDFLKFATEEIFCSEIWGALYNIGEYTTSHNHQPSYFSFVYYVNTPKGPSPLIFDFSGYRVKPKSGKLVIFDSKLYHSVPKNKCDGRSLIAGNFIYKSQSGVY